MLDHPMGVGSEGGFRLGFDARVRLEFHSSKISSDGGLLLFRELDETLGLHDMAGCSLQDTRTGKNGVHNFVGLLRQATFGRLAGYPDVNDADRLSRDPVMRQIVGGRAVDGQAASTSQMARFETDILASAHNLATLADLPGQWIDAMHDAQPPKWITLDMDSSVSPTHGDQEGTACGKEEDVEDGVLAAAARGVGRRVLHQRVPIVERVSQTGVCVERGDVVAVVGVSGRLPRPRDGSVPFEERWGRRRGRHRLDHDQGRRWRWRRVGRRRRGRRWG